MKTNRGYLVYFTKGDYEDTNNICIFFTRSEKKANKWVKKFNSLLDKKRTELKPYLKKEWGHGYVKDKYINKWQGKQWELIHDISFAYYEEIEVR